MEHVNESDSTSVTVSAISSVFAVSLSLTLVTSGRFVITGTAFGDTVTVRLEDEDFPLLSVHVTVRV